MENIEQVSTEQEKVICPHCKKEILPCTETAVDPKLNVKCHKYCCDTMDFLIYSKKKVRFRKLKQAFIRLFLRLNNGTVWGMILSNARIGLPMLIIGNILTDLINSNTIIALPFVLVYVPLAFVYICCSGVAFRNVLSRIREKTRGKIGRKILLFLLTSWIGLIFVFVFGEESIEALRARINKFKTKGVPSILGIGGALTSVSGICMMVGAQEKSVNVHWWGDSGYKVNDTFWGHVKDRDVSLDRLFGGPIKLIFKEGNASAETAGMIMLFAGILLIVVAFILFCKYSAEDK